MNTKLHCTALGLALLAGCAAPYASSPTTGPGAVEEAAPHPNVRVVPVGLGWARTSVNAVVFRGSSVTSFGNVQYTAYYDADARVVLAKRQLGSTQWATVRTRYSGTVRDAHNAISLGVDGNGVLHMAWDEHGGPLRYVHAVAPGSLELTDPLPMTGDAESRVTYPQFYRLAGGDLLFLYRDGVSGGGDVMLNRYDLGSGEWRTLSHPLIAGEGQRNAYMNTLAVDEKGGWHLSWVWRETPDVASNHDVLYAYSPDEGRSWRRSDSTAYALPITAATAEIAWSVPQGSELINQTSMTVDGSARPLIATYWRAPETEVPQFRVVWHDGAEWRANEVGYRTQPFRLSGGGTRRIPISRPQILAAGDTVYVVFRDEERGPGVSVAISTDPERSDWTVRELYADSVGMWEPSYDIPLWRRDYTLHLFLQKVGQGDAETQEEVPPQMVSILEWTPPRAIAGANAPDNRDMNRRAAGTVEFRRGSAIPGDPVTTRALISAE